MRKDKKITTNEYSFTAVYEPVKEGGYQVVAPLLAGLVTYGRTFEETKEMVWDAIICYLESLKKWKKQGILAKPKSPVFLREFFLHIFYFPIYCQSLYVSKKSI